MIVQKEGHACDNGQTKVTPININDLPNELLSSIFHYLHPVYDQLPILAMVCRKWRFILYQNGSLWRTMLVDPLPFVYWQFCLLCSIFRVYGHHVQKLTWRENSPVYESTFSLISKLRNIRCLRLPILWTRPVIESLSPLTQLEQVQINGGYALTDNDLETVGQYFPNLKNVSLNACWRVTENGINRLLVNLHRIETVKLKINSGLKVVDPRSANAMVRGYEIVQNIVNGSLLCIQWIKCLCLHFLPLEIEQLWSAVKYLPNLKKLSISHSESLHGVRITSNSLQKVCLFNIWNASFVSIDSPSLKFLTIDKGLESMEHLEVDTPNLKRAIIDGSNVLRTFRIKSQSLSWLEISNCEDIDMRTFRDTLKRNPGLLCLRLGSISQDSLTFDEFMVPCLQELCLLGDFACETLHIRSPTLRLLHSEAEHDLITLNHMYITANHLCKVALIGMPSLKTLTIQCVSVDAIEMNLCSDDQLTLETCVIHALSAIGFLRLFDCKVNLLSVSTPLARTVVLYRCHITDYVLQMALTGCPNIAYLNLEKCQEFKRVLVHATPLKFLNLFGCSDINRLELVHCPQLLALNVGQCPNIKIVIGGVDDKMDSQCMDVQVVRPTENIRWSHDFPPQPYLCS